MDEQYLLLSIVRFWYVHEPNQALAHTIVKEVMNL